MWKPMPTPPLQRPRSSFTSRDAQLIWRARDAYRVKRGLGGLALLFLLVEVWAVATQRGWGHALALVGIQGLVLGIVVWLVRALWALLWWGLDRMYNHAARRWHSWTGLGVLLVLSSLVLGCGDLYKSTATLVGCDPVAVEAGYCTMPAGGIKK